MSFDSITNRGEFFSNHYLDAIIGSDLGDLRKRWDDTDGKGIANGRSRLRSFAGAFFDARANAVEATDASRANTVRTLNALVLQALGFEPDQTELELVRATTDTLRVPSASHVETSSGLLLVAIDAGLATDVDDLFATAADIETPAGLLLEPARRDSEKTPITSAADAVGELFSVDDPPRFVLVLGGRVVLLAERAKWAEGRFLAVDLDAALERNDTKAKGELETIAALFTADALIPGGVDGDDGQSLIDELVEKSHKHAVGVSKDLRDGIRDSIEILANEVIQQRLASGRAVYDGPNKVDPKELTRQCLRYLYRLIVLLYAESRPELGVLPVNDEAYLAGYSMDRLRELTLVELDTDQARNGKHLDESLKRLFDLVNDGYHAEHADQQFTFDLPQEGEASYEEYLLFPGLDASLFEPKSTKLLDEITIRNEQLQQVLRLLMLSPEGKNGKGRGKRADRGFISYAQLGINQLGAVYEGLMAYSGFFASEDLYEVAKKGDPSDGTWMLPVTQADEYPEDVFVTEEDDVTGRPKRVLHERGSFVFRLSGRDRQRSASYYTPEVLTRCVVKHALAELLGGDDYAPEFGSSGITEATQMLDLTICEPALGSGAFLNEAINQLSAEYLRRRQIELGDSLDAEEYRRELQKVKAHFALHQSYGVDLNATAVELAEVSLWLNAMHPGLKAPWFGLQLRQGNSLIGCRRATWTTSQLGDKPWANTKKGSVQPPVDRKLTEALTPNEIHHFLLPGHGWAAIMGRKEAKELRPDELESLKAWRKTILAAPKKSDAKRLGALAEGVEAMWAAATKLITVTQRGLRRTIEVYGAKIAGPQTPVSRAEAERALSDENSPLGRLRTLMDAWVGLWFWPLDSGHRPPSWDQWLAVAEDLIRPDERFGLTGQLDMFDDLAELMDAQQRLSIGQTTVTQLREAHPWLTAATAAAQREGAWHWDLEFAGAFGDGGFDLQVGNPPWVKPTWDEADSIAEIDPRAVLGLHIAEEDRARLVGSDQVLSDLTSVAGSTSRLSDPQTYPELGELQPNLYQAFCVSSWRNSNQNCGVVGFLHPDGHLTDAQNNYLRMSAYHRLRRLYRFTNELHLFEEIGNTRPYSVNVYGSHADRPDFLYVANLFHPNTIDGSLSDDGEGPVPGLKTIDGKWNTNPHKRRLVRIQTSELRSWAALDGSTDRSPKAQKMVLDLDQESLEVLGAARRRLSDVDHWWSSGFHERGAVKSGTIERQTREDREFPILQGPHLFVNCLTYQNPNIPCTSHRDYTAIDLESLDDDYCQITNYHLVDTERDVEGLVDIWDGFPSTQRFRIFARSMLPTNGERTLIPSLVPPGPSHVHAIASLAAASGNEDTVSICGLWSSLPLDYLVRSLAPASLSRAVACTLPVPDNALAHAVRLRTLRLNCLTAAFAPLWDQLFDAAWYQDGWADAGDMRSSLCDVSPIWDWDAPLRRDHERWLAQVELDALAAIVLGVSASQLCAMYRTQFAVLRKYESTTVFDHEGRKIAKETSARGVHQLALRDRARAGELPDEWTNLWSLYEQYEADPSAVDWMGHYTAPFIRVDREASMTRAYNEFQRRLDAGEYES